MKQMQKTMLCEISCILVSRIVIKFIKSQTAVIGYLVGKAVMGHLLGKVVMGCCVGKVVEAQLLKFMSLGYEQH